MSKKHAKKKRSRFCVTKSIEIQFIRMLKRLYTSFPQERLAKLMRTARHKLADKELRWCHDEMNILSCIAEMLMNAHDDIGDNFHNCIDLVINIRAEGGE